jgi:hypothetical protein
MEIGSIGEIISQFRSGLQRRPVLHLGAGASYRAGIALADEAVRKIAKARYQVEQGMSWEMDAVVSPSEFMNYLESQAWFAPYGLAKLAEAFPDAVKYMLTPQRFRKEFLKRMVRETTLNDGYKYLAKIVQRRLCKTILTTNFDQLIVKGLRELEPSIEDIEEIKNDDDSVALDIHSQSCQIVYLHGVVENYSDKITQTETQRLDQKLLNSLRAMLNFSPLVVVGYRGAEQSIMQNLLMDGASYCNNYVNGIWWCVLKKEDLNPNVIKLGELVSPNLKIVEIDGFDELMKKIDSELEGKMNLQGREGAEAQKRPHLDILFDKQRDDLDIVFLRSSIDNYLERLKLEVTDDEYDNFLIELGVLGKTTEGNIVPTGPGYLLFGKNVKQVFSFSRIVFQIESQNENESIVFEGNLFELLDKVYDYLMTDEINPRLKVKKEKDWQDVKAYHPRALKELLVNMLVHRDYSRHLYSKIVLYRNNKLEFISPGGLPDEVLTLIKTDQSGIFSPIPGVKGYRNRVIADLFHGTGKMEKAGSGLSDVKKYMIESGGDAEYKIIDSNTSVVAALRQAEVSVVDEESQTARPLHGSEVYTTNLIPFSKLPAQIFFAPIKSELETQTQFPDVRVYDLETPAFIIDTRSQKRGIYSFADLRLFDSAFGNAFDIKRMETLEVKVFIDNKDGRNKFIWLIHQHWKRHLETFRSKGLLSEPKDYRKKAYFVLSAGETEKRITYRSALGRNVTRAVVKRRDMGKYIFHENEGITYSFDRIENEWAIRIKPIYMFTSKDGVTPLAGFRRGRLSVRRIKFDKNKNVRDDLMFWLSFLSEGWGAFNIGGIGVNNLNLDSHYIECEVPIENHT